MTKLIQCLTECENGKEISVISIHAGRGAKTRLANLGIFPGTKIIKTRSAPLRGPLELKVKGTTIVIGRGLAEKIIVECNNSCRN